MARFYGGVVGNHGMATRLGSTKSGITAFAQGWNIGVRVTCFVNHNGEDRVAITLTGGSNGPHPEIHLGTYKVKDGRATNETLET